MRDTLDFTFREDSLVLLHRSGPNAPWVKWADDVNMFSNPTDGYGRINVDSLLTGEYAFAWRKSPTSVSTMHWSQPPMVHPPEPRQGHVWMGTDRDDRAVSSVLDDASGRTVRTRELRRTDHATSTWTA